MYHFVVRVRCARQEDIFMGLHGAHQSCRKCSSTICAVGFIRCFGRDNSRNIHTAQPYWIVFMAALYSSILMRSNIPPLVCRSTIFVFDNIPNKSTAYTAYPMFSDCDLSIYIYYSRTTTIVHIGQANYQRRWVHCCVVYRITSSWAKVQGPFDSTGNRIVWGYWIMANSFWWQHTKHDKTQTCVLQFSIKSNTPSEWTYTAITDVVLFSGWLDNLHHTHHQRIVINIEIFMRTNKKL